MVEAGKQSRRVRFPVVTEPVDLGGLSRRIAAAAAGVVLHEEATGALPDVPLPATGEIVVVVVGPKAGSAPASSTR